MLEFQNVFMESRQIYDAILIGNQAKDSRLKCLMVGLAWNLNMKT